ncbi:hypothetical protein MCEMSEM52_00257 [Burkholderiales bacterium]|jgi:hypothetical protein
MQTLQALAANEMAESTEIYLFLDGPKNEQDRILSEKTERHFDDIQGFLAKTKFKRSSNFGLKRNIVAGINQIMKLHDRAIVLEDDLITSRYFLRFMNSYLELYEKNLDVCQISGYSYLEKYFKTFEKPGTYFMRGGDCLAWGTWRRAWDYYDDDSKSLLSELQRKKLSKSFDRGGAYPYTEMLNANIKTGRSWAINWYASTFLLNKYCLYPVESHALHLSGDEGATNYAPSGPDPLLVRISGEPVTVEQIEVKEEKYIMDYYKRFLSQYRPHIITRVFRKISSVIRNLNAYKL